MAMSFFSRTLISKPNPNLLPSIFSRSFKSLSLQSLSHTSPSSSSPLIRLRSLIAVSDLRRVPSAAVPSSLVGLRAFSTRQTTSSLNDSSPNWNNRPPKETILLDGCDFEHWLIVVEKPEGDPTRDEVIDSYIKLVAGVVGSEDEARKQIYSVSTRHYYAIGVIVSEELSYKFKEIPNVRWVLPDSYLNVREKDYGGEPFVDGHAVPYDTKYHEEWVRNNARANERSRRNDRPRNNDRSRNFERRRENMQNRDGQAPAGNQGPNIGGGPPGPNMGGGPPGPHMGGGLPGPNIGGGMAPHPNAGMPSNAAMQNNNYGPPNANNGYNGPPRGPGPNAGYPNNMNGGNGGYGPPRDGGPHGGYQNNGGYPNAGPTGGYPNNVPNAGSMQNRDFQYSRDAPISGGVPPYQNNGAPVSGGVPPYQNNGAPSGGVPPYQNNGAPVSGGVPPYQNNGAPIGGVPAYQNSGGPVSGGVPPYQNNGAPIGGGVPAYQNSGGPGPMPNRDYQNSYTANRNGGDIPSGNGGNNAYQVRDVPGGGY